MLCVIGRALCSLHCFFGIFKDIWNSQNGRKKWKTLKAVTDSKYGTCTVLISLLWLGFFFFFNFKLLYSQIRQNAQMLRETGVCVSSADCLSTWCKCFSWLFWFMCLCSMHWQRGFSVTEISIATAHQLSSSFFLFSFNSNTIQKQTLQHREQHSATKGYKQFAFLLSKINTWVSLHM